MAFYMHVFMNTHLNVNHTVYLGTFRSAVFHAARADPRPEVTGDPTNTGTLITVFAT